jgi:hypothetical protein
MTILYQKMIYREDLRRNRDVLYLFGDNDRRDGFGGQAAEMRGETNAVGVRTKREPGNDIASYWSDKDFEKNCQKIEEDLGRVKAHLRRGGMVVIPIDGLGTGFSQMDRRCPRTFNVLNQSLDSLASVPVTV